MGNFPNILTRADAGVCARESGPLESLDQKAAKPAEHDPEYTGNGERRHDKLVLERLWGEGGVMVRLGRADEVRKGDQNRAEGFPDGARGKGDARKAARRRGRGAEPPNLPIGDTGGDGAGKFGRKAERGGRAEGGESPEPPEEAAPNVRSAAQ